MSFNDIEGQDAAIAFLKNSASCGRVANAYIFSGPGGVGKRAVALGFAKALNCRAADDRSGDWCGKCASCVKIGAMGHPDVRLVSAKKDGSSIGIDEVRGVIGDIGMKPYEAARKVYIIDGADCLTEQAANALLKTLEEPSSHSTLILITECPDQLLPTIRSRCRAVRFFLLGLPAVEDMLVERHGLDRVRAHLLAGLSGGRPAEALKLNDEDLSGRREALLEALASGRFQNLDFDKTPKPELKAMLDIMLTWYRDILTAKAGCPSLINIDKEGIILREASRVSFEKLDDVIKKILMTQSYLDQSANQRLAMTSLAIALEDQEKPEI